MKNLVRFTFAIVFLISVSFNSFAQGKIGYIDTDKLLAQMPAVDSANKKLEKEQVAIKDQLGQIQDEFNKKNKSIQDNDKLEKGNPAKWNDLVKSDKTVELQGIYDRLTKYNENARIQIQQKQNEFFDPIYKKVEAAIKKVGTAGGYSMVVHPNNALFLSPSYCTDITDQVKKELGLK
jgi:outer membrane protein